MVRATLSRVTDSPCWASSPAMVVTSARSGALVSVSGPSDSSAVAISGRAAFFAPEIGMVPAKARPPRMRMRSIP